MVPLAEGLLRTAQLLLGHRPALYLAPGCTASSRGANAFAVATAIANGATLLTGDPEILGPDPSLPVADLRH